MRYLLYLPKGYGRSGAGKRWPTMLFLHGAGERGSRLANVKKHGPPKIVETRRDFPFLLVSPQCPADNWWSPDVLVPLLDEIVATFAVDEDRLYVTGLSMGGYGTWALAAEAPDRFAAAVPICGGGNPRKAARLKRLPIWAFHGAKDPLVPLAESEKMVAAVRRAGGRKVRLTVYPEAQHDSWTRAYDEAGLYDWLLRQKRRKATGRSRRRTSQPRR